MRAADHPAMDAVVERLLETPSRYFPGRTGPGKVQAMHLMRRRLSDVARVQVGFPEGTTELYVKIPAPRGASGDEVRDKAEREFDTLCELYRAFLGVPGGAVVRPVAFFPGEPAIVTEAGQGENLHRLLKRDALPWRGAAALDRLALHCRRAGAWLAHFQRVTRRPQSAPPPAHRLRPWIEAELAAAERLGLDRAEARRLRATVTGLLDRLAAVEFPLTGVHPDFQPDNVLAAPDRVTVLDFAAFHHATEFSDPARFAVSVSFLAKNPLYLPGRLRVLLAGFFAGYGGSRLAGHPAFEFYCLRSIVREAGSVQFWRHPAPLLAPLRRRALAFAARWERILEQILTIAGDAPAPAAEAVAGSERL